jgi:hypothetical protein
MLNLNVNANFNGSSVVNETEVLATFNATYSGDMGLYFNVSIADHELFVANRTVVDADFKAFMDKVVESVTDLAD